MPIDVSRFVVPEQDFGGLYKVSDTIQQNRLMDERKQEVQRKEEEEKRGKTAASMRYFANYLDPKDRYTGTYYDPKMNEYLGEALSQAYDLSRKGAGEAEILTAISPLVNKVNDYQQKAKIYSEGKKQLLSSLKGTKGYNTEYIGKYLDREMFEGKDIDKVDPNDMITALDNVYSKYGAEITNDEALNDLVKNIPSSKITTDISFKNARGGSQRNKAIVDMPNIFIKEEEGGETKFVPKYDTATDFGEDIVADFDDGKGGKVKAPVRLLEENTFEQVMRDSPAVKYRIGALVNDAIKRGEYQDANGNPITINSPQAKNLARAILYDELKAKAKVDRSVIEQHKENPIYINNGGGETKIRDVYGDIDAQITASKNEGKPYLQVNLLPGDTQSVVIDEARKATGNNLLGYRDIKLIKGDNGKIGIYNAYSNELIKYLTPTGTNLKVQPSVKEKREVIKQGNTQQPEPPDKTNRPPLSSFDKTKH